MATSSLMPVRVDENGKPIARTGKFRVQGWMKKMIEVSVNDAEANTIQKRCELAGITYGKYLYWWNKPGFAEWYNGMITSLIANEVGQVHTTLHRRAVEGNNPSFMKMWLERFDPRYVPAQKHEVFSTPPPLVITMPVDYKATGLLSRLPRTDKGNAVVEAAPAVVTEEEDDGSDL